MKQAQIDTFKGKLLAIRQALLSDVDNIAKHSNDEFTSDVPDLNDEATRTYHRQVMLSLGEVDRNQVKRIDEALEAIENGEYGTCIDCEDMIPLERLESVPYAKRCVDCKTKWEESQKG